MTYLALDYGTSYIKTAILDTGNRIIHGRKRFPALQKRQGRETRHEIDAELLWQQVRDITNEYLKNYGIPDGILISTQMHGFILTDDTGHPVTPYVSWQDERCLEKKGGKSSYACLEEIIKPSDMANTGVNLKPNLGMCNLYTLLREETIFSGSRLCTLGSYIIQRMTGNNICHISNAAPMGLVDLLTGEWCFSLIRKIGFHELIFPEITAGFKPCGTYLYNQKGIPVYPDLGDHQASILGSLTRPDEDININIGTAGLIGVITNGYNPWDGETRPLFGNWYINTVRGLFGGRDIDVLTGFLGECVSSVTGTSVEPKQIWKLIGTIQDKNELAENSLCVNNAFYTNGAIMGINHNNFTFSSLISALYSSAAKDYSEAFNCIDQHTDIRNIIFSGGAACKNPALMKRIAEEIGCSWECSPVQDEVMLGLFRAALLCSGEFQNIQDTIERARIVTILE